MKTILTAFVLAGLCACASQSPYTPAGNDRDYGYSENRITENRYRVDFRGNTRTSSNEVKDMALLRAAELTLLNDYDWFRVVGQETEDREVVDTAVSTTVSSPTRIQQSCGLLGCTNTLTPGYPTTQIATSNVDNRYNTSIEIVMGRGKVEDETEVYNATELRRNLSDY